MIQNNVVLPTVSLDEPDPQFGSTHFNNQVLQKHVDAVASCSRGKGGLNTVVVLQRHN
jgi:3-oxoacyl-(acyl-carrier-protein) synthase